MLKRNKQANRLNRATGWRGQFLYETLEAKRMLAGLELGYTPQPTEDAFSKDAVTFKEMVVKAATTPYVKHELVVALKTTNAVAEAGLGKLNWSAITGDSGASMVGTLSHSPRSNGERVTLVHLRLSKSSDIFSVMRNLDTRQEVMWSSPNFTYKGDPREFTPNDPQYPNQWHHDKMQNNLAWDVTLGSSSIIVAVTDDGVELNHEDLQPNIWQNDDFPFDGEDNDLNGFIDDYNGWDFNTNNNNPNPNSSSDSHGTHVSGIAAARTNNALGVSGVAGRATIMPIQFYGPNGWTSTMVNNAFTYATNNGAKIVNTSYNVDGFVNDPVFLAGLQYLYDGGVLHFNSAGNNGQLNPPRQQLTQTLLVASTEQNDSKSSFSNYGTGIDIAAPGNPILSTLTGNSYGESGGTSMAAPAAAGAAALIWSANPTWTREQVAAQLHATADNIDALNPGLQGLLGGGRANSFRGVSETIGAPKIRLVNNLPANGGTLDNLTIDNFDLAFTQIMDPAAMNNIANYQLLGAGVDKLFGTSDDVTYTLNAQTYQIGTNLLNFKINEGTLPYGKYRLTVTSGGVQNPFGTDLDGDNNGSAGGDFVSEFTLSPPNNGSVFFTKDNYKPVDLVNFTVADANATNPLTVTITTSGGDSETVTLNDNNNFSWSGSITTNSGTLTVGNGQLEVVLGQTITVSYLDQNTGNGNSATVTDTALISNIVQYISQDTPINIIDNNTVTSVINVPDEGVVGDINVEINITHTYDGDLDAFLVSPDGVRIALFQNVGGAGDNFSKTLLDDEAANPISSGSAPFTGSFRPAQPLSSFDLKSITGNWTLEVRDEAGGDVGTIDQWSMFIDVRSLAQGALSINKSEYSLADTVNITVVDSNHTGPMTVAVTTTGGDTETVTLALTAPFTYTGSINTAAGAPGSGNNILDVAAGQTITVTYNDQNIGNGSPGQDIETAMVTNVVEYPSSDVPVTIPDNSTVTSIIEITDEGIVNDLDVKLDITHTWDSDLDVFLIAPDGTRVELFTGVGDSGDNFEQTRLDDEAADSIADGSAPFNGRYRPEGLLSALDGKSITGIWTLEMTDTATGDPGVLNDWSLFVDVGSVGQGSLFLDKDGYNIGESVEITVLDGNHTGPMTVEVTTSRGDSETVTLTETAPRTYTGSIVTVAGTPGAGNGQLDVAAGQSITVKYVDQDNGSGSSNELTKTANVTNRIEFPSSDVPVNIVDNDTVISTLEITDSGTIADLDLSLDITHTWVSDLDVFLIAPDGTRVELFSDVGGSGDDFSGTYLDDEASTSIADGFAPFTGSFRPTGSLSVLDGLSITGTWTLEITDNFTGDDGTLDAWSLWIDVLPDVVIPDVAVSGPSSVTEGNSGTQDVTFTVTLSEPADDEVKVDYATTTSGYSIPATPNDDFIPVSGTLTFLPGETSKDVVVQVRGNRVVELDESFGLALSNVVNGNITTGVADLVIVDNDNWVYNGAIDFGTDTS
ncbi:MAG: S8 family serine peptidase, partial [Planctomycetota bacterium]